MERFKSLAILRTTLYSKTASNRDKTQKGHELGFLTGALKFWNVNEILKV